MCVLFRVFVCCFCWLGFLFANLCQSRGIETGVIFAGSNVVKEEGEGKKPLQKK